MINKRILGLIPARGGSKGLPNKNIKAFLGKSLIERTFDVAKESQVCSKIIISTDSDKILEHARTIGLDAPFKRPDRIASDQSPMVDVILHAVRELEKRGEYFDYILLLQPTSPLRSKEHLQDAVDLIGGYESLCSVVKLPLENSPDFLLKVNEQDSLEFFTEYGKTVKRRQDVRPAYQRNGVIYLFKRSIPDKYGNIYGEKCFPFILSKEESISIDTQGDWDEAIRLMG